MAENCVKGVEKTIFRRRLTLDPRRHGTGAAAIGVGKTHAPVLEKIGLLGLPAPKASSRSSVFACGSIVPSARR